MIKKISVFLTLFGMIAMITTILGLPIMLLWNWLMPSIFGIREITFMEAIGLNFLSTLLFKSFVNKK